MYHCDSVESAKRVVAHDYHFLLGGVGQCAFSSVSYIEVAQYSSAELSIACTFCTVKDSVQFILADGLFQPVDGTPRNKAPVAWKPGVYHGFYVDMERVGSELL